MMCALPSCGTEMKEAESVGHNFFFFFAFFNVVYKSTQNYIIGVSFPLSPNQKTNECQKSYSNFYKDLLLRETQHF